MILMINIVLQLEHLLLILFIILLIIYYVYNKCKYIEKFSNDDITTINNLINQQYKADIEAIRNLSNYATYLMNGNTNGNNVKVPSALTATTSLSAPTINATTSLTTPTVNATTSVKIGNTVINETQLKQLLNLIDTAVTYNSNIRIKNNVYGHLSKGDVWTSEWHTFVNFIGDSKSNESIFTLLKNN